MSMLLDFEYLDLIAAHYGENFASILPALMQKWGQSIGKQSISIQCFLLYIQSRYFSRNCHANSNMLFISYGIPYMVIQMLIHITYVCELLSFLKRLEYSSK